VWACRAVPGGRPARVKVFERRAGVCGRIFWTGVPSRRSVPDERPETDRLRDNSTHERHRLCPTSSAMPVSPQSKAGTNCLYKVMNFNCVWVVRFPTYFALGFSSGVSHLLHRRWPSRLRARLDKLSNVEGEVLKRLIDPNMDLQKGEELGEPRHQHMHSQHLVKTASCKAAEGGWAGESAGHAATSPGGGGQSARRGSPLRRARGARPAAPDTPGQPVRDAQRPNPQGWGRAGPWADRSSTRFFKRQRPLSRPSGTPGCCANTVASSRQLHWERYHPPAWRRLLILTSCRRITNGSGHSLVAALQIRVASPAKFAPTSCQTCL
jgi:hypothetical protein